MPPVAILPEAFGHPSLRVAGRALRMSAERLGWRLVRVWSLVLERQDVVLPEQLVAAALELKAERAVAALVDAELAAQRDAGQLDLSPLRFLFAAPGEAYETEGEPRPVAVRRGQGGRFQPRDWRAEILPLLDVPRGIDELAARLGCQVRTVRERVRELEAAGAVVISTEDGQVAAAVAPVTGAGTSAGPAPAPALEPCAGSTSADIRGGVGGGYNTTRSGILDLSKYSGSHDPADGVADMRGRARGNAPVTGAGTSAGPAHGTGASVEVLVIPRARTLYEAWRSHVIKHGAPVDDPGELAGPYQVQEALQRQPQLGKRQDRELLLALELLAEQCAAKLDAGELPRDAWSLYQPSVAWRSTVLLVALECGDIETARARAVQRHQRAPARRSGRGPGLPPSPREDLFLDGVRVNSDPWKLIRQMEAEGIDENVIAKAREIAGGRKLKGGTA